MSMRDAFLADIIEHPDDDTPRLIFADWLEDQDDPASRDQAEFIRTQIQLETLREEGLALWALQQREKDLLREYRATWAAPCSTASSARSFGAGSSAPSACRRRSSTSMGRRCSPSRRFRGSACSRRPSASRARSITAPCCVRSAVCPCYSG